MMSPSEIEQARARVSVACLRWLRPEFESSGWPGQLVVRAAEPREARPEPRRVALSSLRDPDNEVVRATRPPVVPGPRGRDHPLWDRWIDG